MHLYLPTFQCIKNAKATTTILILNRAWQNTAALGGSVSSATGDRVGLVVGRGEGSVSGVGSSVGSYVGRSPLLPFVGFRTGGLVGRACGAGVRAGEGLASGAGVGGIGDGGRIVGGTLVGGALVGKGLLGAGLGLFVGARLGRFDGAGVAMFGVGSINVGRLVGRAVNLPSSSATLIPET